MGSDHAKGVKKEMKTARYDQKKAGKIRSQFICIACGIALLFAGYGAMSVLQTSINITDGIGSKAIAASYITSLVFTLFLVPYIIRVAGVKLSIIASEFGYVLYLAANYFRDSRALLVGCLLVGIGEGVYWATIGLLFVEFGRRYQRATGLHEETCVTMFSAILFTIFQMNTVIGNLIVFVVLRVLNPMTSSDLDHALFAVNTTAFVESNEETTTLSGPNIDYLQFCGANDCQVANVTSATIDKYVPDAISLYVMISCLIAVMLTGIAIHLALIPAAISLDDINNKRDSAEVTAPRSEGSARNGGTAGGRTTCCAKILAEPMRAISDTFRNFLVTENLLLLVAAIYQGLSAGFLYGEVTRAYVSCLMGVSAVGIMMVIFGIGFAVAVYLINELVARFGRMTTICCQPFIDSALYMVCLLWQPHPTSSWVMYPLILLFSVSLGAQQIMVSTGFALFSVNDREISFVYWNAGFNIGFIIQFAWSSYLCVRDKLYVHIALMVVAYTLQIVLQRKKTKKEHPENAEREETYDLMKSVEL